MAEAPGRNLSPQLFRRRLRRTSRAVGSALGERLIDIGGREDTPGRRDGGSGQTTRVARTIETLVMRCCHEGKIFKSGAVRRWEHSTIGYEDRILNSPLTGESQTLPIIS